MGAGISKSKENLQKSWQPPWISAQILYCQNLESLGYMFVTDSMTDSSKLRWWHMNASMADHQCTSATSVHRSSVFPFVLGFVLLTMMTWLCHVLGPRIMVCAVSASRHLRFGTCRHLISRTVMLVANSSSRALRLGSLCKPAHKRCLWELLLSGALQILDLIDWLIDECCSLMPKFH